MKIPFFGQKKFVPLTSQVYATTDVGSKRSKNEDNFVVLSSANCPSDLDSLFAVADGMGGHEDGDIASRMAVEGLDRLGADRFSKGNLSGKALGSILDNILRDLNDEIISEGSRRNQSNPMGTTLTAVVTRGNRFYISHVGDSRAYLLRGNGLTQLTTDHSWVQQQVNEGVMSESQARVHPRRNLITQALGISPDLEVESFSKFLEPNDLLLLCSDGLHGLIENQDIASMLKENPPRMSCQGLIDKANEAGGDDNITVVIAEFTEEKI